MKEPPLKEPPLKEPPLKEPSMKSVKHMNTIIPINDIVNNFETLITINIHSSILIYLLYVICRHFILFNTKYYIIIILYFLKIIYLR